MATWQAAGVAPVFIIELLEFELNIEPYWSDIFESSVFWSIHCPSSLSI
jgi:hypothetical protein